MGNSKDTAKDDGKAILVDARRRHFFRMDDEVVDEMGERIGATGIAIYAVLCRHSDGDGKAFPGHARIAKRIGVTRQSVVKFMKILGDCGMLETRRTGRQNRYILTDKSTWTLSNKHTSEVNDVDISCQKNNPSVVNDVDTKGNTEKGNTDEGLIDDVLESPTSASPKEIADIINVFTSAGYKVAFGNTTERDAANRIILTRGFIAAKIAAETAVQANKVPYAPKITKPSLLEDKWQELRDWYMRAQAEHKRKAPSVAIIS